SPHRRAPSWPQPSRGHRPSPARARHDALVDRRGERRSSGFTACRRASFAARFAPQPAPSPVRGNLGSLLAPCQPPRAVTGSALRNAVGATRPVRCTIPRMIRLFRTHLLRPYRGVLAAVVVLQAVQALASLYLPTLNAD